MNCNEIKYNLIPYIENTLSEEMVSEIKQHLLQCNDCSKSLAKLQFAFSLIEKEKSVEANPFLFTRIIAKIEARQKLPSHSPVYQRVLKPVIIVALILIGLFIGVHIGSFYKPATSSVDYPSELMVINDMSMEALANFTDNNTND